MEGFAKAFSAILKKIADFFDIFDLSFFIAGTLCLTALVYAAQVSGYAVVVHLKGVDGAAMVVFGAYICGLVAFALSRMLRTVVSRIRGNDRFGDDFVDVLAVHGLDKDPVFKRYIDGKAHGALYTRLWVELREHPEMKVSFTLANRYWVMAATYDGLATALLIWAGLLVMRTLEWGLPQADKPTLTGAVAALLAVLVCICMREARRCDSYQASELAASVAFARQRAAEEKAEKAADKDT